jgi:succinyl-diaminopimelate desuccinylase
MNKDNLIKLTQDLIRANSTNPPGNEKEVVDVLKNKLESLGLKVELIEVAEDRPNLLATWEGGEGKELMLEGHSDTVPVAVSKWKHGPFSADIEDNKIYGRGATDMKGGLASVVTAIESLKESGWAPKGKLSFLVCCNEEMGDGEEVGMRHMADKVKPDLFVITDTTDFKIVTAEKGALWVEFTAHGKEAHGSTPWKGVNAIEKLGKFLIKLNELELNKEHPNLGKSTVSINTISGGVKTNVVPGLAKSTVDIRTIPGLQREEVFRAIDNLIAKVKESDPDMNITYKEEMYARATEFSKEGEAVDKLRESFKEVTGQEAEFRGEHGSTGAGLFVDAGLNVMIFGPGKPELCHISDEYVDIEDLVKAAQIYEKFIRKYFE